MIDLISWLLWLPLRCVLNTLGALLHVLVSQWAWLSSACVVVYGTAAAVRQVPDGRWPR